MFCSLLICSLLISPFTLLIYKVNYCIRKLIEKGWVKLVNFSNNPDKAGYTYLLTPTGIEEKGRLTISFLKIKLKEYQMLKIEIEKLKKT